MKTKFDPTTLDFYAKEAPVYAASTPDGTGRHLPNFMAQLSTGAKVLELGCGGGRDAEAMIAQGFDVDATDGAPALAKQAEMRLGRSVRVMRFDELTTKSEYDGVYAAASLLHVPRTGLPDIIARIHRALRPGGIHLASFKGGGKEGRDRHGRYFNYPDANELEEMYRAGGNWEQLEVTSGIGGGYDGKQGPWHAIMVTKPD